MMNTYAVIKQQKFDDEQEFVIARPTDFDTAVEIVIQEREAERNADWYFFVAVGPERLELNCEVVRILKRPAAANN